MPHPFLRSLGAVANSGLGLLGMRLVREAHWEPRLPPEAISFQGDGMLLRGRNLGFLHNARFRSAYDKGMNSGHHIGRQPGSSDDIHIDFRVYVECWAAEHALHHEGDFVFCGVNTGINPLAICEYIDFAKTDRRMFLFDTYDGIPESQMSDQEKPRGLNDNSHMYSECYELARSNFAAYPNAHLVRGLIPETLEHVEIERVAYLSIDMNIAYPERRAIEHFWPKMPSGGLVMLDDYGFTNFESQHETMNEFASSVGVSILTLPTGQGLIVKP